jgi:hypothetical protein
VSSLQTRLPLQNHSRLFLSTNSWPGTPHAGCVSALDGGVEYHFPNVTPIAFVRSRRCLGQ